MGRRASVPNRQYTDEFKLEAVRPAESAGGNQAAKRLGILDSRLWNRIRLSRVGKLFAGGASAVAVKRPQSELEAENARLRRELANAKLDLEIKKNSGVFREGIAVKCAWIEQHRDRFTVA